MAGLGSRVGADMQFWSKEVPAGKKTRVPMNVQSDDEIQAMELLHITNMALGEKPKEGARYTVKVACEGSDGAVPVGTLLAGKIEQAQLDLIFSEELEISHTGPTSVFLSGYRSVSYALPSDIEDDSEDDYDEDEDSSEDEDEPPELVPANGIAPRQVKYAAGKKPESSGDEDEDDMEDESSGEEEEESDEDEGSEGDVKRTKMAIAQLKKQHGVESDDEDSDDVDEDGDDEDDSDAMDAAVEEEDDEDSGDEEDSSGEDEESSEGEEEEDEEPPVKATPGKKRQGSAPAVTPPPKKSKGDALVPGKTPAKTPAKTPGKTPGTPGGGVTQEYLNGLVSFLKQSGKSATMSELGSKVRKPQGLPKLKEFLQTHKKQFKINPDNSVQLA